MVTFTRPTFLFFTGIAGIAGITGITGITVITGILSFLFTGMVIKGCAEVFFKIIQSSIFTIVFDGFMGSPILV